MRVLTLLMRARAVRAACVRYVHEYLRFAWFLCDRVGTSFCAFRQKSLFIPGCVQGV